MDLYVLMKGCLGFVICGVAAGALCITFIAIPSYYANLHAPAGSQDSGAIATGIVLMLVGPIAILIGGSIGWVTIVVITSRKRPADRIDNGLE
jgi:cell division protein FtsX